AGQQLHEPVGERVRFSRARRGENHLVADRLHAPSSWGHDTLASAPCRNSVAKSSYSAGSSAGGQKRLARTASITASAQPIAALCASSVYPFHNDTSVSPAAFGRLK